MSPPTIPVRFNFVMLQQKGQDIASSVVKRSVPDINVQPFVSDTARDSLVALAFGTAVSTARQHVLRDPLEAALQSGDAQAVEKLAQLPGFWEVLEIVESSAWMVQEGRSIALAAHALGTAGLLQENTHGAAQMRERLLEGCRSLETWGAIDSLAASGLLQIARLGGPSDLEILVGSIDRSADSKASLSTVEWLQGLNTFLDGVQSESLVIPSDTSFRLPGSPADWMDACAHMVNAGWPVDRMRRMRPILPSEEVAQAVGNEVVGGVSARAVSTAKVMAASCDLYDSHDLPEMVLSRLRTTGELTAQRLDQHLSILEAYDSGADAVSSVLVLAREGWLYHQLNGFWLANDDDGIVNVLSRLIPEHIPLAQPPNQANAAAGFEGLRAFVQAPSTRPGVVKALAQRVGALELSAWFAATERDVNLTPLTEALLAVLAESGVLPDLLDAEATVIRWELLRKTLAASQDTLEGLLARRPREIARYIVSGEFEETRADLYASLARAYGTEAIDGEFVSFCEQHLAMLSKDRWLAQLRKPGALLDLAKALQDQGAVLRMSLGFREAARIHAKELLGGAKRSELGPYWNTVERLLDNDAAAVLRDWIFDDALSGQGKLPVAFLDTYAGLFRDEEFLSKEHRIVQNLLRPVVDAADLPSLRWVVRLTADYPAVLAKAPHAHLADLLEKVESAMPGAEGETAELLQQLGDSLRIRSALPRTGL